MALSVTHTFASAIADDATAAAKGEVLPSHWNATHTVTGTPDGLRASLTADTTYNVTATGSDTTGDGSVANPWLTLQHAITFIASTLDVAGFNITIDVGAGTFAGFGMRSCLGGGTIQINGAGSASTTITDGPNDGFFNFGEVITFVPVVDTLVGINKVTIAPTNVIPGNITIGCYTQCNITFGDIVSQVIDLVIDATQCTGFMFFAQGPNVEITVYGNGPAIQVLCGGVTAANFIDLSFGAVFRDFANWTFTGPANTYQEFYNQYAQGFYRTTLTTGFTDNTTGGIKGFRFEMFAGGTDGTTTLNWFPGDTPGHTVGASATYHTAVLGWQKSGAPDPTDAPLGDTNNFDSAWYVFKDTANGPRTIAYNDNGTMYVTQIGPSINTQTSTNYTLGLYDQNGHVEMNNAGANTLTVPSSSTILFPTGTEVRVTQAGAGATTITLASTAITGHNFAALSGQWGSVTLYKRGADEWVQTGY